MKWVLVLILLVAVCEVRAPSFPKCLTSCSCSKFEDLIKAYCNSFDFLKNVTNGEKSLSAVFVHNAAVTDLPSDIIQLTELKLLSLKSGKLVSINTSVLPSSLQFLDLTDNYVEKIQGDWNLLSNLKKIVLTGNPICDCNSLNLNNESITMDEKFADCEGFKMARKERTIICNETDWIQNIEEENSSKKKLAEMLANRNPFPLTSSSEESSDDDEGLNSNNMNKICHINCSTLTTLENSNKTDVADFTKRIDVVSNKLNTTVKVNNTDVPTPAADNSVTLYVFLGVLIFLAISVITCAEWKKRVDQLNGETRAPIIEQTFELLGETYSSNATRFELPIKALSESVSLSDLQPEENDETLNFEMQLANM